MATREEVLRALRFRDNLTTRDVGSILDYVDQEVGTAVAAHIIVQDEGSPLAGTPHDTLNFIGGDIVASDAGGGVVSLTISATPGDNLGNHIATQDLDMANFDILNADIIRSADATIDTGAGQRLDFFAGDGLGPTSGVGGTIFVSAGDGAGTSAGGDVDLRGGDAGVNATGSAGGDVSIVSGASAAGDAGRIHVTSGGSTSVGVGDIGGELLLRAGFATGGAGGPVDIEAGDSSGRTGGPVSPPLLLQRNWANSRCLI